MTERIKLTEDIIFSTVRRLDYGGFARDTTEHDANIIQQILDDAKIIEHILNCHNCGSIGWSNCKIYRQELDKHEN